MASAQATKILFNKTQLKQFDATSFKSLTDTISTCLNHTHIQEINVITLFVKVPLSITHILVFTIIPNYIIPDEQQTFVARMCDHDEEGGDQPRKDAAHDHQGHHPSVIWQECFDATKHGKRNCSFERKTKQPTCQKLIQNFFNSPFSRFIVAAHLHAFLYYLNSNFLRSSLPSVLKEIVLLSSFIREMFDSKDFFDHSVSLEYLLCLFAHC